MKILKFTTSLFPDWLRLIRHNIPDRRVSSLCIYTMEQVIFSGLMLFLLRYRSLRSFCLEHKGNDNSIQNFNRYISIPDIPSDDELRYCLQGVPTKNINNLLKLFHQKLERKKVLKSKKLFNKFDLVSIDGTGQLHSSNINCETCLKKQHSNGETQYYHGQLLASLTNLNSDFSLPLQFEPIQKNLNQTDFLKNDCELNAAKRLIPQIQSQFPKRRFCFLGDNLFAVEPVILLIGQMQSHFILTAKEERNKEVFFMFNYLHEKQQKMDSTNQPPGAPTPKSHFETRPSRMNFSGFKNIFFKHLTIRIYRARPCFYKIKLIVSKRSYRIATESLCYR